MVVRVLPVFELVLMRIKTFKSAEDIVDQQEQNDCVYTIMKHYE